MYLMLKQDIPLTEECMGLKLIRDLMIYGKISLFEYFHTQDLNEIGIESCDHYGIEELKKEYQRILNLNPQSDELPAIEKYLRSVSFKNSELIQFKQIRYLKKRIKAELRRELKTLSHEIAQKIYSALSFSYR